MKLLYCKNCQDVFNLTEKVKRCSCKLSSGNIKEDTAQYAGEYAEVLSLGELLIQQIADPESIKIDKKLRKDDDTVTCAKVIRYLNEKAGTNFSDNFKKSASNFDLIRQRLNEGFTFEEICAVVDRKCKQWLNTDQQIYLRPSTLFNRNKFQNYIGELENVNPNTIQQPTGNNQPKSSFSNFAGTVEAAKGLSFIPGRENG